VSGYLDTTYGLRAERKLTKDLTANGRFAYTLSEFEGSERVDKVIDAGAGLRYFVSRTVYLGADYRLIDRNSDDPIAQYARDQFMLSIGLTPGRSDTYALRPEAGESALQIDEPDDFAGLYIGATGAYGTFQTVTDGARGESGTDVGAMGDDGGTIGVFVGIGTSSDRWYIGLEAETETSNADWYHQKAKDESRTATVEKHGGYGIGLRFGTILDQGQLVFLRAMGVRTEFHSYYTQNNLAAGAYDQHEEVSGLRVGVGADIPAGDNLFIRLEYAYTEYNAYDVAYLSTSGTSYEKFNNEENMARLGLGWLFGAHSAPEPYPVAEPISGFYAGAQVGPSTLETKLTGLHIDGGAPPPSSFTGEFSDQGWAPGAFFGYGFNVERWYFGAELEANTSDAVWEHVRESAGGGGGRDFSVAKKSDYGLSLRLGYSLRNATLVYMRVGAVNGRFNTAYEKGNNAAQYIARSDTLNGIRAGMGAEIPIGRTTFLRMDFTHTNYDSFSFVTAHGGGANADQMTFNNSENLFRFGLGFRF
jgi:opacity protein-like surface antigen